MTNEIIFYFANKKDHLSRIRQRHDLENKEKIKIKNLAT
jgi:hypothetical protein